MKKEFMRIIVGSLIVFLLFSCSRDWSNPLGPESNNSTPSNGLAGYYPFNGNANDESGNGNNFTIVGPYLAADRNGNANSAFSFDGMNDYMKADATNLPSAERTISLWFYAKTLDNRPGILGY